MCVCVCVYNVLKFINSYCIYNVEEEFMFASRLL